MSNGTPRGLPRITADVIIEIGDEQVVLVRRRYPPLGWALPGGFLEYGESLEACAIREAKEETGLAVELVRQLGAYSDPGRDPRGHTVTVAFVGRAQGTPAGGDDAAEARAFPLSALPQPLVFDHARILADYLSSRRLVRAPG